MVFHPYPVRQRLVAHLKTYRKFSQIPPATASYDEAASRNRSRWWKFQRTNEPRSCKHSRRTYAVDKAS
jgi:hypothetical protein